MRAAIKMGIGKITKASTGIALVMTAISLYLGKTLVFALTMSAADHVPLTISLLVYCLIGTIPLLWGSSKRCSSSFSRALPMPRSRHRLANATIVIQARSP